VQWVQSRLSQNALQLQWDYQIEWPRAGRPKIKLLRFRSYQKSTADGKLELVEQITEDIPVNGGVMNGISKHAAGYLANSDLDQTRATLSERYGLAVSDRSASTLGKVSFL